MRKVQIGAGGVAPFEFSESAEKFCGENFLENGKLIGEIKIVGEIVNDDENLKIRGKVFCQRKITCDRCLSETKGRKSSS